MTSHRPNRITIVAAFVVPAAVAVWLWTAAAAAVPSTSAFIAVLLISAALVGLNTWKNGQATGSLAQVIHEADTRHGTPASGPGDPSGTTRWDIWQSRGDALVATDRDRALLAASAVVTGALLLYAWLS